MQLQASLPSQIESQSEPSAEPKQPTSAAEPFAQSGPTNHNEDGFLGVWLQRMRTVPLQPDEELASCEYFLQWVVRKSDRDKPWTATSLMSAYAKEHPNHRDYSGWISKEGRRAKCLIHELQRAAFPAWSDTGQVRQDVMKRAYRKHRVQKGLHQLGLPRFVAEWMQHLASDVSQDVSQGQNFHLDAACKKIEASVLEKWPSVQKHFLWKKVNKDAMDSGWADLMGDTSADL